MRKRSVIGEFRDAFYGELDAGQQSALIGWLAFTGTFGAVRGITHAIRAGKGPFSNLSLGGEHLQHYMWGIGMLAGVGAVAVRGDEKLRRHPVTARPVSGVQADGVQARSGCIRGPSPGRHACRFAHDPTQIAGPSWITPMRSRTPQPLAGPAR